MQAVSFLEHLASKGLRIRSDNVVAGLVLPALQ
jgi:hypothetical protein